MSQLINDILTNFNSTIMYIIQHNVIVKANDVGFIIWHRLSYIFNYTITIFNIWLSYIL